MFGGTLSLASLIGLISGWLVRRRDVLGRAEMAGIAPGWRSFFSAPASPLVADAPGPGSEPWRGFLAKIQPRNPQRRQPAEPQVAAQEPRIEIKSYKWELHVKTDEPQQAARAPMRALDVAA
jgi:hypothetical protein